ncbi:hypothetical protein C2S52_001558 [Perilla frutescens var. hirtella]|nr:hypothetical protein C2S52_001558 [Perilla frutescens var. hirtella]
MDRKQSKCGNRFFKIMIPGSFEQKLKVPPAFRKKLKREKSKKAIIEGCRGRFTVGVGRHRGDDEITFEDGWPQLVDKNELSVGDLLVFEHTGDLHFKVGVFGASTMERHYLDHPNNHHQQHCRGKREAEEKTADSQILHFSVTMRPYTATKKAKVCIPAAFGRCHNLEQKSSVKLRDGKKREFAVKLQIQSGMRPFLSSGWHHFYVSNELKTGDVCVFKLDPTSITSSTPLFDVKVLRNNQEFLG